MQALVERCYPAEAKNFRKNYISAEFVALTRVATRQSVGSYFSASFSDI
jgi:hypothetical protein